MTDRHEPPMAWYAVRTKPHREEQALANYINQNYTVYLPRMRYIRSHARRREEVRKPVFPGYLFLRLPADPEVFINWTAISSTRGVIGPVCFGESYVPVPDWVIETLKAREDEKGLISPGDFQKEKLQEGCELEVEMADGSKAKAVFCSFRGKDNVEVLLQIMQREARTLVSIDQVRVC